MIEVDGAGAGQHAGRGVPGRRMGRRWWVDRVVALLTRVVWNALPRTLLGSKGNRTRRLSLCVVALVGMVATVLTTAASTAAANQIAISGGSNERSHEVPLAYPAGYVALGDSYSSGVGAPPYDLDTACQRSSRSYPPLWTTEHHPASFTFAACSGAKTADVLATQISALQRNTDLVTITIGGNDAGFGPVLQTCTVATSDRTCAAAVDAAEAFERTVLPGRLTRTYTAIRRAAPNARVIVLGYPRLFDLAPDCTDPHVPNLTRRRKLNHGADVLNDVIRQSASRQSGFSYIDVRDRFTSHGVCSADPWIHGPSVPTLVGPYHPNQAGYLDGYLPTLDAATARGSAAA
ncbi:MAG: SGNH/GDSL hydrolase family protein [Pseudonocardiales bacterium]|nr:SGNH/GDSL hydrolase family protein [Pseudonocardiales bacterium]